MSKEIFFFATKTDIETVLKGVESKRKIKYICHKSYDKPEGEFGNSFKELKGLGFNHSGDHQSESYFVFDSDVDVNFRESKQVSGGYKYFLGQDINPASIVFWPGGICKENFLVCGHMATISDNPTSIDLYGTFRKEIVKLFKSKVNRYYIGPDALSLKDCVRFVTMGINQPEIFDVKP
jgi:hypothetical protein